MNNASVYILSLRSTNSLRDTYHNNIYGGLMVVVVKGKAQQFVRLDSSGPVKKS